MLKNFNFVLSKPVFDIFNIYPSDYVQLSMYIFGIATDISANFYYQVELRLQWPIELNHTPTLRK